MAVTHKLLVLVPFPTLESLYALAPSNSPPSIMEALRPSRPVRRPLQQLGGGGGGAQHNLSVDMQGAHWWPKPACGSSLEGT